MIEIRNEILLFSIPSLQLFNYHTIYKLKNIIDNKYYIQQQRLQQIQINYQIKIKNIIQKQTKIDFNEMKLIQSKK